MSFQRSSNYSRYAPDFDKDEHLNYTGAPIWNAIYTIQLGELIEHGLFDWSSDLLNWENAAYNPAQYARVCEYFIERFRYREISIEPYLEWAVMLHRKLVFELMPKYKPLYERVDEGVNPLQVGDEYYKRRTIGSEYPETLLSGNADYISTGQDEEHEKLAEGSFTDAYTDFANSYHAVDELLCDELECLFIGLYTVNANAL